MLYSIGLFYRSLLPDLVHWCISPRSKKELGTSRGPARSVQDLRRLQFGLHTRSQPLLLNGGFHGIVIRYETIVTSLSLIWSRTDSLWLLIMAMQASIQGYVSITFRYTVNYWNLFHLYVNLVPMLVWCAPFTYYHIILPSFRPFSLLFSTKFSVYFLLEDG